MTLRQVADLALQLLLERVDRTAHSELVAAAVLLAAGAKDIDIPDPEKRRAAFLAALHVEPKAVDPEQAVLMDALGVR